jgi:hypothetical protein
MPRSSPARPLLWSVALLLGGAAAATFPSVGCSYASSETATPTYHPSDTGTGGGDAQIIEVGSVDGGHVDLCGAVRRCDPDRADICSSVPVDAGLDAGSDVGDAEVGVPDAPTLLACRVVREGGSVVSSCAAAGTAADSAYCTSDDDCRPGLACVGDPGRCLPYCCGATAGADPCGKARYCATLAVAARPDDRVPVCAPLDNCPLLQDQDHCPTGSSCTVVRNDGATTCVPIGTGRDLQACPCDRGYVCLGPEGNRLCRKLCNLGDQTACGAGTCEALSTIPTTFGICTAADGGI